MTDLLHKEYSRFHLLNPVGLLGRIMCSSIIHCHTIYYLYLQGNSASLHMPSKLILSNTAERLLILFVTAILESITTGILPVKKWPI